MQEKQEAKNKTAIIVFGNLASGKSTVCEYLKKRLPEYSLISADSFRLQFENDFSFSKEAISKANFEAELLQSGNVIWETTLSGKFSLRLAAKLAQSHRIIRFKIDADPATCFKRFFSRPLPPTTVRKELKENIYAIDEILQGSLADLQIDSTKFHPSVIADIIKTHLDAI